MRRVLDQALDAAEALAHRPGPHLGQRGVDGRPAAVHAERDHAAEAAHLARGAVSWPGCDFRPG